MCFGLGAAGREIETACRITPRGELATILQTFAMRRPGQCDTLLRGWKAIEDFLGLTRKTVLLHGYPVRHARNGRRAVWAFADELEAWARQGRAPRLKLL